MDRETRNAYQKRQNYRRIPINPVRWRQLREQAKARGVTRTELARLYLCSAIDTNGEGVTLTAREKDWEHAQAKERTAEDVAQDESRALAAVAEVLRAEKQARWIATGANLLHGSSVVREILRDPQE